MEKPVLDVVSKMAHQAVSPEDFDQRVVRIFGTDLLPEARSILASIRGEAFYPRAVQMPEQEDQNAMPSNHFEVSLPKVINVQLSGPERLPPLPGGEPKSTPVLSFKTNSIRSLLAGVVAMVWLMLFPPHVNPLQDGMVNNAGFLFLFEPLQAGKLNPIVDTPLLAVLALMIAAVSGVLYFVFRQIEGARRV